MITSRILRYGWAVPVLFLVLGGVPAHAQELNTSACLTESYNRLSTSQRKFRSVLLGQRASVDLPVGAVRYDRSGNPWRKTSASAWRTLATGFESTTWSNAQMDQQAEFSVRRGLLEAKKMMTSDLIPSLLQAVRAFQCETRRDCMAAKASLGEGTSNVLAVKPPGCIEFQTPRLQTCRIVQPPPAGGGEPERANFADLTFDHCDKVRQQLIDHETKLLSLLVSYDVAYRSLLQFAGSFDDFTRAFREPVFLPFLQSVRILRTFSDMPCFTAQCDE